MYVLLPPSETKAPGGDGPALDLDALAFPALNATRQTLIGQLSALCGGDRARARAALGVAASKDAEIEATAELRTAATRPALQRYTGVLYDALDLASLPRSGQARAGARLLVASALFGMVRGDDAIPAYRFSAGSRLPGRGPVAADWRAPLGPVLADLLADGAPVVDLRSGAYAAFAPAPGAITVRVLSEAVPGDPTTRSVVSHFSKHAKGLLARALVASRADMADAAAVVRVARKAGLRVERTGPTTLELIT
ncbi:peroxide stress protein YaaA [Nakamurella flava]|uniref:Peroxide stress protein YaaA n=1 Tax=Nakamurella flava TaxID=2576308 RepID=A0A4U6QLJ4_9ACTN|nr:peroxide stress protein YaaA [Nakamurella flava]TKV61383.1 peroxide stress protein YaaA [Nakamurella flava]